MSLRAKHALSPKLILRIKQQISEPLSLAKMRFGSEVPNNKDPPVIFRHTVKQAEKKKTRHKMFPKHRTHSFKSRTFYQLHEFQNISLSIFHPSQLHD